MLLVPVVGAVAFLTLSGATQKDLLPTRPRPRLTGGWAFVLALVLGRIVSQT